jgi:hypothetical protein
VPRNSRRACLRGRAGAKWKSKLGADFRNVKVFPENSIRENR